MRRLLLIIAMLAIVPRAHAERGPWSPIGKAMSLAATRMQVSNLTYLGGFRGPVNQGLDYCQCAMYYDPLGNGGAGSLFVATENKNTQTTGVANWGGVLEITIPANPVVSSTVSNMPRALVLQPDTDATEGALFLARNGVQGVASIQGLKVVGTTLYINAANNYDPGGSQIASVFIRSRTLATTGSRTGPFGPLGGKGRQTGGFLSDVSSAWQGRLGAATMTGLWSENTIQSLSFGYDAFTFNLSDVAAGNWPFFTLLQYPEAHPLGPSYGTILDGQTDPIWTPALSGGSSAVMPAGYDTVMLFGGKGTGGWCYGEGTADMSLDHHPVPGGGDIYCYDPEQVTTKGGHGYPTKAFWWLYDANDLYAVKSSTMASYAPRPYAYGQMQDIASTFDALYAGFPGIRGAAYDLARNRIYVAAQKQDAAGPIFHAFQVN